MWVQDLLDGRDYISTIATKLYAFVVVLIHCDMIYDRVRISQTRLNVNCLISSLTLLAWLWGPTNQ